MNATDRIGGEVFDSRDVGEALGDPAKNWYEDIDLYRALMALEQWGEDNVSDWQYGETLIREDYFTQYAEELAEEIGAFTMPANDIRENWPFRHIDWEAAAEELKQDYTEIQFQGQTYLVRSC